MRDLSVTCNAPWEQFKMVDDKKTGIFFLNFVYTQAES